MRKFIAVALAGGLLIGVLGPASAAPKPTVVWEDPSGDADMGQGLGGSIPAGLDLESGTILAKGPNLEFTAIHADMPPIGSLPEFARFLWSFNVGKDTYRLTVKSADIGKPDVSQGQTTERVGRADVTGHFRLEGDCGTTNMGIDFINCKPLAYLEGTWDPASKSFTVVVPMKLIKAKPGSVVAPGSGDATQICASQISWVSHYAERSLSPATCFDTAPMLKSYKIPK